MKYYKALNEKDMIFADRTKGTAFAIGELFTEKELKVYCEQNSWNFDKIVEHSFIVVEIPSRLTYRVYGCRFA